MPTTPRASRFLEATLLLTIIAHGIAMLGMATLLLPGMPGGPHVDVAWRAVYVAGHPWFWRIGWLSWQVTAASDLLLAIALVATRWIPKTPAILTLIITLCGLIPDQYGQAIWTWHGVQLARDAVSHHDFGTYLIFESHVFRLIAGWGSVGYLTAAFGWTWCFAAGGTWNRRLTTVSFFTWGLFGISTIVIFLPSNMRPDWIGLLTSTGNAIAFVLLMIWLIGVSELVLRRSRPTTATGHWSPWRHPSNGLLPRILDQFCNSRWVRYVGEHLPILAMTSDITDLVYINYLVDADRLEKLVPPMLKLQRVGPRQAHAMFSILVYRHGHFGPICFGSLRRLWPSPIQSNWRIYVIDPRTQKTGVHFVTTAITSTPHALASRLLSEGVPMHIPRSAELHRDITGAIRVLIDPGNGSSPDLRAEFRSIGLDQPPPTRNECYSPWNQMLEYCVPQDRAIAPQPCYDRVVRQEISLGIPLDACIPLVGKVESIAVNSIIGNARPFCFGVGKAAFEFYGENFDP